MLTNSHERPNKHAVTPIHDISRETSRTDYLCSRNVAAAEVTGVIN